jgi:hypothetical protein
MRGYGNYSPCLLPGTARTRLNAVMTLAGSMRNDPLLVLEDPPVEVEAKKNGNATNG